MFALGLNFLNRKNIQEKRSFFGDVSDILTLCIWLEAVRILDKDVLAQLKWIHVDSSGSET
jgi:hypothetical protein